MKDTIKGQVTEIIDGDTFDMNVTQVGKNNKERYNAEERVRISGIDTLELPSESGRQAKDNLEKKIKGKAVRCNIETRDTYGRIVASIEVL